MDPKLQRVALAMTRPWQEDAYWLNFTSWSIAARKVAMAEEYALALRQSKAATRLEPANGNYLNTLGVALFRCGKFEESLKTLATSDKVNSLVLPGRLPEDVAFLAMAQFKVGEIDKARESLEALRRLMKQPRWLNHAESQGFLSEAIELIEGKR